MTKIKIMKITAFAACLSLLFSIPVFAVNGQQSQNSNNNMNPPNNRNMYTSMGGINTSGGGINTSMGGINTSRGGINTSMGGIDMHHQQNGMQNNQQSTMQNQQNQQNQQLSNAAQFMVNKGIIKGDSSGSYSMSNNVKRCDMSLMLVRAFNLDTANSTGRSFGDVAQNSYYYEAVNTMKQMGIAKGDGENFNPTQNMTLQEAILFVERALTAAGVDYSDVDLESLFEGRSLSDNATREDVSTILYAVLGEDYLETSAPDADEDTVADTITYETEENTAVTFDEDDFDDACKDATGYNLSYVKFTLPSTSYGTLYYTSISDVTFVPAEDYTGTVKIYYTGYNTQGETFTGTVKITVE